jgi:hypothetical protein
MKYAMRSFSVRFFALLTLVPLAASLSLAQTSPPPADAAAAKVPVSAPSFVEPPMPLHATSTMNLTSEIGGAFMPPVKCDADGNLYIRKFASNRPRGPVVKIDPDGKPTVVFDPGVFASLGLDRVDAFSPAPDGGIYQIAQTGLPKPRIYVLHYSSDGSPSSPARLDADFEVYTFAAFPEGSFLVSGTQRDPLDKNDHGHGVTKVFSADGRELAQLSFPDPKAKSHKSAQTGSQPASKAAADSAAKSAPGAPSQPGQKDAPPEPPMAPAKAPAAIDLKDAEVGRDGNLYVMRTSAQALVDVISPSGKIMKTLKIAAPLPNSVPTSFHVSENRLALLFWNAEKETLAIAVVDAQTGRKIAAYSDAANLGSFACYSANDGVFTFLKHGDKDVMEVIRAEAQ